MGEKETEIRVRWREGEGREKGWERGIQGRGRDKGVGEVILVYWVLSNEYECGMYAEWGVKIPLGVSVFTCLTSWCKPFL